MASRILSTPASTRTTRIRMTSRNCYAAPYVDKTGASRVGLIEVRLEAPVSGFFTDLVGVSSFFDVGAALRREHHAADPCHARHGYDRYGDRKHLRRRHSRERQHEL